MATSTNERPTAAATASSNQLLRLYLSLSSLSTASKVIAKHHGGRVGQQRQHQTSGGSGAFWCKTCGRAFPTFQALGGHRTSHKRPLVRAHGLDLLLGARPGKGAASASDVHRCSTCGAVFPTGQALGGHMRRHRAAAAFDFGVAVHGESETATRVVIDADACLSGEMQGESDDDDVGPIRLFKFI